MARIVVLKRVCTPLEVEVLAIKEALNWVFNMGYNKIVIQTYSKIVVNLTKSRETFRRNACFILEDVKLLLNSCPDLSCNFTFKEVNNAAHIVTKHSAHSMSTCWFFNEPLWLSSLLYKDLLL